MKCGTGRDLNKAAADGEISQADLDAVEEFKEFLIQKQVTRTAQRCPTCVHSEGYDRLSGPCPTCHGDGVIPPEGRSS